VLTIEAVLILTILGIGLFVGLVAVRDAIFKYKLSQQDHDFYVFDSSDPAIVIGKALGFDEHEAALVAFIDYGARTDANGDPVNHRALIGVRDDRFTSRQPIFYTGPSCTGDPCIAGPSDEGAYNIGVDNVATTGAVGYLYALQGVTYGIGVGRTDDPATLNINESYIGRLYRQDVGVCGAVQSAWYSQRVVTADPCQSPLPVNPVGLYPAVSVDRAVNENVLDPLTAPFYTNMISTPSTTYISVPPDGEG